MQIFYGRKHQLYTIAMHMTSHKTQTVGCQMSTKLQYKLTDLSLRSNYEGREYSVCNILMEGK